MSLASQVASVFAGGLAPLIAVALLGSVDERNTTAVSMYIGVAATLTFVSAYLAKETVGSSLKHDRPVQP